MDVSDVSRLRYHLITDLTNYQIIYVVAIDDDTRKKYAVKIIDKEKLAGSDSLSRKLNNEVYALKKLQGHPHIVQVKDVIETEKQ